MSSEQIAGITKLLKDKNFTWTVEYNYMRHSFDYTLYREGKVVTGDVDVIPESLLTHIMIDVIERFV